MRVQELQLDTSWLHESPLHRPNSSKKRLQLSSSRHRHQCQSTCWSTLKALGRPNAAGCLLAVPIDALCCWCDCCACAAANPLPEPRDRRAHSARRTLWYARRRGRHRPRWPRSARVSASQKGRALQVFVLLLNVGLTRTRVPTATPEDDRGEKAEPRRYALLTLIRQRHEKKIRFPKTRSARSLQPGPGLPKIGRICNNNRKPG